MPPYEGDMHPTLRIAIVIAFIIGVAVVLIITIIELKRGRYSMSHFKDDPNTGISETESDNSKDYTDKSGELTESHNRDISED